MITTPHEYYSQLHLIQNQNKPQVVILNEAERIYNVDLNTRKIETPEFLSVEKDHFGETIYFMVDQYYDGIDLAETTCIVQYINAKNEKHIYAVPFFDTITQKGKIIFPWCVEGAATVAAGDIKFAFKFYHTFEQKKDDGSSEIVFEFNLNTLPARSKILNGLDVDKNTSDYSGLASQIEIAIADLNAAIDNGLGVYWVKL